MQSRKSRTTWSNMQVWPWSTKWSRTKAVRVLPRKHIGHSKHHFPTTQKMRWEYQTTLPASWKTCMQFKSQQLEPDIEQWTGSKLGREYIKTVYCHHAYLIYMQGTSCEMAGWVKHKLESRLPGETAVVPGLEKLNFHSSPKESMAWIECPLLLEWHLFCEFSWENSARTINYGLLGLPLQSRNLNPTVELQRVQLGPPYFEVQFSSVQSLSHVRLITTPWSCF